MPVSSAGENITHFTAIRLRINGIGELQLSFHSLDEVYVQTLVPYTMQLLTNREPTRLANFMQQRAYVKGETNGIGEFMRINRIIIFAKETFSSFPG